MLNSRRWLSPVGGALGFLLVAALVVGGLGWVTVAALRVEAAEREATARADLLNQERLALWQLDGRLFPAIGVETNRPYAHYFALSLQPAVLELDGDLVENGIAQVPSPLLSADLPDWMPLHFQLDPDTGWESPQVLRPELADKLRGAAGDEGVLRNATPERRAELDRLRRRFPVRELHATLVGLEAADAADGPPAVPVYPGPQTNTANAVEPTAPAPSQAADAPAAAAKSAPAPVVKQAELAGPPAPVAAAPEPTQLQAAPQGNTQKFSAAPARGDRAGGAYESRKNALEKGTQGGLANAPANPAGEANNERGRAESKKDASAEPPAGPPPAATPQAGGVAGGLGGFGGGRASPTREVKQAADRPRDEAAGRGVAPAERAKAQEEVLKAAKPAAGAAEAATGPPAARPQKAKPTPDAERQAGQAEKELAEKKADRDAAKAERPLDNLARRRLNPSLRPPAVHLGPVRPHWLTAADGTRELVLVRAARLETKVVFQGVLLDWPKLRAMLTDEVRDAFPAARLEPVADAADGSERRMAAIPASLDPGPPPPPPAAGWSPLRIGLALAWAAALLALAAVGIGGAALLGLSERRIRFVSAVTHELRTPLTSLRLYLDLLTSGMVTDEDKRREYLNTLSAESDRLNRLIENVLDFARLEKRTVRAHRQPTPVAEVIEQVRQTWADRAAADGKELVVVSTLPPDLLIPTDPRMAGQILGNLIDNARKYARGSADPRIWLWAKPGDGRRVVFEVEDRGPGVPAADRCRIFRPFRRGRDADTAAGGAGLGLALAAQWADMLGGSLTCRPAAGGVGACFRLELPVR